MIFAQDIISAVTQAECQHLATLATGKLVLEVGSEYGRSTIALASTAKRVHAVDWHRGDQQSGFKDSLPSFWFNLQRYNVRDTVIVHAGKWEEIAPLFGVGLFDLAFVDGDHHDEPVMRDFRLTTRVVKVGGLMVFHDTDQPAIMAAIRKVADEAQMSYTRTVGSFLEVLVR